LASFEEERKKISNKIKGGKKKSFRRLREWNVENKILYGIMFSLNLKISDLAKIINVSPRTVQAWVFEGRNPNEENKESLSKLLGYPEYILFYDLRKGGKKWLKL